MFFTPLYNLRYLKFDNKNLLLNFYSNIKLGLLILFVLYIIYKLNTFYYKKEDQN
jgi:hypothetical protein